MAAVPRRELKVQEGRKLDMCGGLGISGSECQAACTVTSSQQWGRQVAKARLQSPGGQVGTRQRKRSLHIVQRI